MVFVCSECGERFRDDEEPLGDLHIRNSHFGRGQLKYVETRGERISKRAGRFWEERMYPVPGKIAGKATEKAGAAAARAKGRYVRFKQESHTPLKVDCMVCGVENDYNKDKVCFNCGAQLPKPSKEQYAAYHLGDTEKFEKAFRVKSLGKIKLGFFELLIPLTIGILLIVFLPSFIWLGIAIVCIAPYFMFRRTPLKGPTKLLIIIFSWLQFFLLTPQLFVSLIILWAGYFSLPTKYKEDDSEKQMEAFIRTGLGLLLSFNLYMALGGQLIFPPSSAQLPVLLMSLAFFFTFPAVEPKTGGITIYMGVKGIPYTVAGRLTGALIFYTLMIFALVGSLNEWSFSSSLGLSFLIFWVIGFFLGLVGGREGRPYTGVIVVLFAVFFFSAQFTGVVGTQIFGQWWPQIQAFGESAFAPLNQVSTQAAKGIGDAWLLITNPAEYYRLQTIDSLTKNTNVQTGGTVQSIEVTNLELFSPNLDPLEQPLIGTAELENQGEFDANNVTAHLTAFWTSSETGLRTQVGELRDITCSPFNAETDYKSGEGISVGTCRWSGTTFRGEIKTISFVFNQSTWGELQSLGDTKNYVHSGEVVEVNLSYDFGYSVNVSLPIEVINQNLYQTLLQSKEINPQQVASQYSGGPVKASIVAQRQPIKNQDETLILASITNDGTGTLSSVDSYQLYVPYNLSPQAIEGSTFRFGGKEGCAGPDIVTDGSSAFNGYYMINCTNDRVIKPGTTTPLLLSFFIKPNIGGADRKTYGIVGLATYTYASSQKTTTSIAPFPISTLV